MADILGWIVVASTAILAVRVSSSGLIKRYRAFFFYLVFYVLRDGTLSNLPLTAGLYQKIWVLTEPLEWFFYVLVVLELYALVLRDYKGLSTAGRWALIAAVLIAVLASGLTLLVPSASTIQGPLMRYFYVADRAVYFSLMVFLLTILAFLVQYPITLSRNVIVHSLVFSVYFLGNTMIFSWLSTRRYSLALIESVKIAVASINIAALAAWLFWLTPAGELRMSRLRPAWMPGREEVLAGHLTYLNAALLRAARK
jgi:hypothetical protein